MEPPKPEEKKEAPPSSKQAGRDKKAVDPKAKKDDKKADKKLEIQEPTPEELEAARLKEEEEKAKYFTDWKITAPRDLHNNLLLSVIINYVII